jgi:hypothetical protein
MLQFLWQATKGHHLRPWKSPYLRWRIETYWGLHAERIGFREFWRFVWKERRDLLRFLKWADTNRHGPAELSHIDLNRKSEAGSQMPE